MQETKTPLTDEEKANIQLLEITDDLVMGVTDPDKLKGSLVLPDCVTGICNRTFRECTALTRIVIPKSVTRIGRCAFTGCISLTELTVDSENPVYCSEGNCIYTKDKKHLIAAAGGLKGRIVIPDGVTKIGLRAFSDCTFLTKVEIPKSVTRIAGFTFTGCTMLKTVIINAADVKNIKADVFENIYDDDVHFTVKTDEVKTLLKKSCLSILDEQITVEPNANS